MRLAEQAAGAASSACGQPQRLRSMQRASRAVGVDSGVKSEFRFQCLGMHASGTWRLRSACGERGARHDVGLLIGSAGLALAA